MLLTFLLSNVTMCIHIVIVTIKYNCRGNIMGRISKFKKAQPKIEAYLDSLHKHIFSFNELSSITVKQGYDWDLGVTATPVKLIAFLIDNSHLTKLDDFTAADRYAWRKDHADELVYELALSLKPRSYLSHYTAMFLHNMTEQVPKTIYVTFERASYTGIRLSNLTQSGIDAAFAKEPRKTTQIYTYQGFRIVLVNAYRNNHIGIQKLQFPDGMRLPISSKERTLIDATIRPDYAGGISEVIKAYQNSVDTVQVNRIKAYLTNLQYTYPIQQSIGFLMEYAGFAEKKIDTIHNICTFEYSFYLERQIKEPFFSKKWNLYYPHNLKDRP